MTSKFLEAMFDLGSAIERERWRLEDLARSLDDVGMEKLADRVTANIGYLEALYERMRAAFGAEQSEQLRQNEKWMGETLLALLDNATKHSALSE